MSKRKYQKHGFHGTKLYAILKAMKQRVRNPIKRSKCYEGVDICDLWMNDSESFFLWAINNGYQEGLQIDRIDSSKGYSPENCRWVTAKVNSQNRKTTRLLFVDGRYDTIANFSEAYGINHHTVYTRISRGWSDEDAVKTPVRNKPE